MSFNVRVYGILINDKDEILLSDERYKEQRFTKFPGGGLKYGEGVKDCLKREIKEELKIDIEINSLFYVTDFFVESAFKKNNQVIGVYYLISSHSLNKINLHSKKFDFSSGDEKEAVRWIKLSELKDSDVDFSMDKVVVRKLLASNKNDLH